MGHGTLLLEVHCPELLRSGPQSKAVPTLGPFLSGHKGNFFFCSYGDIQNLNLVNSLKEKVGLVPHFKTSRKASKFVMYF